MGGPRLRERGEEIRHAQIATRGGDMAVMSKSGAGCLCWTPQTTG